MTRIQRITRMENNLDISLEAVREMSACLEKFEAAQSAWKELSGYYGSTQWMRDHEADEAGRLPADLKRGVLSEDAVYDLIAENRELMARMAGLVARALKDDSL